MSDSTGQIVWSAVHWPFGKPFEVVKTKGLRLRFPGQWAIGGTGGLSYNWNRFYDPKTGRYTRPDPLGFVDGPSVYAYVGSNPQGFVDPDGRIVQFIPFIPPVIEGIAVTAAGIKTAIAGLATAGAISYGISCMAGHNKGKRPSTKPKHEEGDARRQRDAGGERGDDRREPPRKRPKGHKGPWPPRSE